MLLAQPPAMEQAPAPIFPELLRQLPSLVHDLAPTEPEENMSGSHIAKSSHTESALDFLT